MCNQLLTITLANSICNMKLIGWQRLNETSEIGFWILRERLNLISELNYDTKLISSSKDFRLDKNMPELSKLDGWN